MIWEAMYKRHSRYRAEISACSPSDARREEASPDLPSFATSSVAISGRVPQQASK